PVLPVQRRSGPGAEDLRGTGPPGGLLGLGHRSLRPARTVVGPSSGAGQNQRTRDGVPLRSVQRGCKPAAIGIEGNESCSGEIRRPMIAQRKFLLELEK